MNVMDPIKSAPQILAWRISFSKNPTNGDAPTAIVTEPGRVWAHKTSIDIEYTLQQSSNILGEYLDLIWLESGTDVAWNPEKRVEQWLAEDGHLPHQIVRGGLRTIQIAWSRGRAVVLSPAEHLYDVQDAIIRFTSVAWQTQALEEEMSAVWPIMHSHIPLLHSVTRQQRKMQGKVDAMTERTNRMNLTLLRLYETLEQLVPSITPTSKRLFSELCLQASLEARLDAIEGPIDNAVEHYELANDRLIESKNATSGRFMETLIILVLLMDLAFSVTDLVNWRNLLMDGAAVAQSIKDFKISTSNAN